MPKRMTEEEYDKKFREKLGDSYVRLSPYISQSEKIKVKHLKCNHVYDVTAEYCVAKRPTKCPRCYGTPKETLETFKIKVYILRSDEYTVIDNKYEGNKIPIEMRHNTCGRTFKMAPNNFINAEQRCPHCFKSVKLSQEKFVERVKRDTNDEYEVLSEYENVNSYIIFKHKKCGNVFSMCANNFLNSKQRCPQCMKGTSKAEEEIAKYLDENNIKYERQYIFEECKNIKPLPFDFLIVINGNIILIEVDGEQHFKPKFNQTDDDFKLRQKLDNIKTVYCEDNNLPLYRISYKEDPLKRIQEIISIYKE